MRLIDADALKQKAHMIEIFDKQWVVDECEIDLAPTIDAVSVIRCGKCKYRGLAKVNCKGFTICPVSGMEIADDYCSYGEPTEGK